MTTSEITRRPAGYPAVSPYLLVADARGAIAFMAVVFGAATVRVIEDAAGRVRHAEVRIDDSLVMLAERPPEWPAAPAHLHVYVADVDAAYARALAAGAQGVQAPARREDPDKRGGVLDQNGITWWMATPSSPTD